MELKKIRLSEIKPYEKNARKNDEAVEYVVKSIEQCEYIAPIILDENNVILAGHTRYKALKKLGYTEAECVIKEGLTEEQKKKYRLLDNKTAEYAEWDFDLLEDELSDLDFGDLEIDWGVEAPEFDTEQEIIEDEVPEIPKEPKAKYGDIYQLGNHRLMCGDSTKKEDIEKLMNGEKADMVFTDPPYNIQVEGGGKGAIGRSLRKQGKDIKFIADFNPAGFLNVLPIVFKGNMNAYIFCNKELLPDYLNWCKENKYSWNVLIWKKPTAIPIGDSHRPDIEYLLLFRKNALWNNGTDANYSRCLQYDRVKKSEENGNHPTLKPIELITNELKISSNKNSVVVDFLAEADQR